MSRSEYSDDYDTWALIRWRGAVNSAIKGIRGQKFFIELLDALEAMPVKRLIEGELETAGEFCTLGVLGHARQLEMTNIDPENTEQVADLFKIADALVREVVYMNDEASYVVEEPEKRWIRMHKWVRGQITTQGVQA